MGWLVGTVGTNIHKIWIPQSNHIITSRDLRIDEKGSYDPKLSMAPQCEQALSTTLNEIDLDKSDSDFIRILNDNAELVEAPAKAESSATSKQAVEGD